jgi:hypothetical protein
MRLARSRLLMLAGIGEQSRGFGAGPVFMAAAGLALELAAGIAQYFGEFAVQRAGH